MRSRTEDSINANSMLEKQGLKLLDLPNEVPEHSRRLDRS